MIAASSIPWFARHELRLAWRDALAMLRGGRRGRPSLTIAAFAVFWIVLHLVAYGVLSHPIAALRHPDKSVFVALTGSAFLTWTLLLSQGMETVTRSFYARADLDVILSSPAPARRLFAVRIGANAVSTATMAAVLVGPVIDVAAWLVGPRILSAYGVLLAMAASALALAVVTTSVLFRVVGAKRTRVLAQIVAAIVGAGFVVGVQAAAILTSGTLSRLAMFRSPAWIAAAPGPASPVWWPARAALGDGADLAIVLVGALCFLSLAIAVTAQAVARHATTVVGLSRGASGSRHRAIRLRSRSRSQALRWKEWALLRRDPWLVSQSLMQVLYLLPPALLLWHDVGTGTGSVTVLVPVLVMAAGQLAGGLAWLAISGEDAPDLIATAPVSNAAILRAKTEAVMVAVALPILPIVVAMGCLAPFVAATTVVGAGLAAAGASAVQLFFKSRAKRSNFRRRQTSSRLATFAEAFLSISVAAAAGLTAAGLWPLAPIPAVIAVGVIVASRAVAKPAA